MGERHVLFLHSLNCISNLKPVWNQSETSLKCQSEMLPFYFSYLWQHTHIRDAFNRMIQSLASKHVHAHTTISTKIEREHFRNAFQTGFRLVADWLQTGYAFQTVQIITLGAHPPISECAKNNIWHAPSHFGLCKTTFGIHPFSPSTTHPAIGGPKWA